MTPKYDRLPEHMREGAAEYVERRLPPGGFMYAVLCNDLTGAIGKADEDNLAAIVQWAHWLWWDIPSQCWGSPAKVEAWLAEGGE